MNVHFHFCNAHRVADTSLLVRKQEDDQLMKSKVLKHSEKNPSPQEIRYYLIHCSTLAIPSPPLLHLQKRSCSKHLSLQRVSAPIPSKDNPPI